MNIEIKDIRPLEAEEMERFFRYLKVLLLGNGKDDTPLFQPISRIDLPLSEERMKNFSEGMTRPVGQPGWRRIWVALDGNSEILGHIDLRDHLEEYTEHRALLGMGVNERIRRQGLGLRLIETIVAWGVSETAIEWIDIWVLSNNTAAVKLYTRTGFKLLGKIDDLFRIDGASEGYLFMSRKIQ